MSEAVISSTTGLEDSEKGLRRDAAVDRRRPHSATQAHRAGGEYPC